ncbi:MAG: UDP-N-acetylglucosamine 1-carboxyvinyltransferase [Epsilonproteobacteria bacterium]|nr:UDP-N-acetylglucosamine 1-carboxyvinyltransferase [Campylobacterota bacterium]NPA56208.1 UDP-N-acetylglucosamine 1-carboxyvinyltransferase [Campylobacterota bacterium]
MDFLQIRGRRPLSGSVTISGAKNAALPLIAATILAREKVAISNLPDVKDIQTLLKLLDNLGARFEYGQNRAVIDTSAIESTVAKYDIVRTMRASILVLGPLLARFGHCEVSLPGGCAIGQRPIDLHLKAMERMGAEITIKSGYVVARAPKGLRGTTIIFDKITVTGTENVVMAAALAQGKTTIINPAKEPEVTQLCRVLKESGVEIEGIESDELTIYGTGGEPIEMVNISVIPDRIEAGTYLCAGAITNSQITVRECEPDHLEAVIVKLMEMGFPVEKGDGEITIYPTEKIYPVEIITSEYPGFPTDMQAQFMALSLLADGTSIIEERLFENRFMHASELMRFGATIQLKGSIATVIGPTKLYGADVMATDLRASSALVLAGLAAEGVTNVHRIYHLDRGYERLEKKLQGLGADIVRLKG